MFNKIEHLLLIGISVSFKKVITGFKLTLRKEGKKEFVVLPFDHLNEFKILKYIDLMEEKLSSHDTKR